MGLRISAPHAAVRLPAKAKQLGGIGDGEGLHKNGVHQSEDRSGGADAESQRENGSDGECRGLAQAADGVAAILQECFHEWQAPLVAILFLD